MGVIVNIHGGITRAGRFGAAFERIVGIMQRLRAPDGCPWDREQTLVSLKTYVIEEAYEVLDAIDSGSIDAHVEELGDLLLQVVFQAQLRDEAGEFDSADVCNAISDKLIARHPHVFGDGETVADSTEVLRRWEGFKKKKGRGLLDGVPVNLPALLTALRISDKCANVGFDWPDEQSAFAKVEEEVGELKQALASGDRGAIESEMGDLFFSITNIARMHRIDPESALRDQLKRFKSRFKMVEDALSAEGKTFDTAGPKHLDELWEAAKAVERQEG